MNNLIKGNAIVCPTGVPPYTIKINGQWKEAGSSGIGSAGCSPDSYYNFGDPSLELGGCRAPGTDNSQVWKIGTPLQGAFPVLVSDQYIAISPMGSLSCLQYMCSSSEDTFLAKPNQWDAISPPRVSPYVLRRPIASNRRASGHCPPPTTS